MGRAILASHALSKLVGWLTPGQKLHRFAPCSSATSSSSACRMSFCSITCSQGSSASAQQGDGARLLQLASLWCICLQVQDVGQRQPVHCRLGNKSAHKMLAWLLKVSRNAG